SPTRSPPLTAVLEDRDSPLVSGAPVISDTAGGNSNGVVDPGETINLTVPVSNTFTCTGLSNVVGTLTTATPGITLNQPSVNYGTLDAGATANSSGYQFRVASSVPCGTQVTFTLTLTSAQGAAVTRTISVVVGQTSTGTATRYTYTGPPVPIPDASLTGAVTTLTLPVPLVVVAVNPT